MENRNITTKIIVCSYDELNEEEKKLIDAAKEATNRSYSPYSRFQVGAAALLSGGTVITGSNQENAAYPSGICAERTTLCQLSISRFARRGVGDRRSNQRGFHRPPHSTLWSLPAGNSRNRGTLQPADAHLSLRQKRNLYRRVHTESAASLLREKRFAGIGYGKILYISKYRGQLGMKNRFVHFILPSSFPIFVEYIRYGSA